MSTPSETIKKRKKQRKQKKKKLKKETEKVKYSIKDKKTRQAFEQLEQRIEALEDEVY